MTKRYDVLSPRARKNSDKPFWHRVGTAFEGDKGISIVFDSLPLPDSEGVVRVSLFEQRDQGTRTQAQQGNRGAYNPDEDDTPF